MAKFDEFLVIRCFVTCVSPDWSCCLSSYAATIVAGHLLAMANHGTVRRERGKQLLALH